MDSSASIALPLLQTGVLMGVVLLGQVFAVRHLPLESIPGVLRGRVALSNRLRPWLISTALAMAVTGLVLHLR